MNSSDPQHWSVQWYGWRIPDHDDHGHPLRRGMISAHPVLCSPDCPAIGVDGLTHLAVYCRVLGCHDVEYPPGHRGPLPNQATGEYRQNNIGAEINSIDDGR